MKSQLQVYARLKPTIDICSEYFQKKNDFERESRDIEPNILSFQINISENANIAYEIDRQSKRLIVGQKYNKSGFINNMKETMEFNFTDILDINATQEQVFQQVAVPVVQNCLDGYNGTIFAYGQTGSGKTYTINGSDSWAYRGIIPRVMTYIFDQIDERKDEYEYTVYASYMEIYNEKAYDLLNEDHLVSPIEQWTKIEFKRDHQGNIHLNNISLHEIDDAKPGIDLLMMGNYIRKQAATPMNQCSSRSHCIFTLTFEAKQIESNTCFVSKLNLVDLAGSERVSKTNHDGTLLNEAKNINLSLSYLEQVIVALNEKKKTGQRQHIPYRHSILTTILKDSLGGNCKTVMIANISTELDNFEETISALRFSVRVGQLENEIHKNQKIDLNSMVEKLEQEKQQLLDELQKYQKIVGDLRENESTRGRDKKQNISQQQHPKQQIVTNYESEEEEGEMNLDDDQDLEQILNKVDEYMQDKSDSLDVRSMVEAKLCFRAMKEYHKSTMADYLKELSDISKKLQQYDALLPQASKKQELQPQIRDSDITQMALNNFYPTKQQPPNRQSLNGHTSAAYHDENLDPEIIQKKPAQQNANFIHQPVIYQSSAQYIPSAEAAIISSQQQEGNYGKLEQGNRKKKQQSGGEQQYQQHYEMQQQQQSSSQQSQQHQAHYIKQYPGSNEDLEINLYKQQQQQSQQMHSQQSQQSLQRKGASQHPLNKSKNENSYVMQQQNPHILQQHQQQQVKQEYQYQQY